MPIYEYQCAQCGHVFEEIQRISDPDPEKCPQCESGEVGRLISQSAFLLRGGGWYAQNYESGSSSKSSTAGEAKSSGGESKSPGTASTAASDTASKPASKPAAK